MAKKWRKAVLRLLKTAYRRYRIQRNALGELRVQCNDTWFEGGWSWQTMGRKDGRNQWCPFVTREIDEVEAFIEDDRELQLEAAQAERWTTLREHA